MSTTSRKSAKSGGRAKSGGGRIKQQGRSLVWATFDPAEKVLLRTAAGISGIPMSEFVQTHALKAAQKIVDKINPAKPARRSAKR